MAETAKLYISEIGTMEALSFELTIDERKKPKPFTIRKRLLTTVY